MSTKSIRFDYFKPCLEEDDTTECNLVPYLQYLLPLNFEARMIPYSSGHHIRLGFLQYYANFQPENSSPFPFPLWQLVFTRIRPDVPGVTRAAQAEITPLELDDDESIAEDTVALYDPELNYLVIQSNRTGAPPSVIKQFFNKMNNSDTKNNIELQIVIRSDAFERACRHQFHQSIHLRITNARRNDLRGAASNNATLVNLINVAESLATEQEYPIQAELSLKIPGRRKDKTFFHQAHNSLLNLMKPLIADDAIDKLVIKGSVDEESQPEVVDIIQDVMRDWISFEMDSRRFISSSAIFDKLAKTYAQRRPSLLHD